MFQGHGADAKIRSSLWEHRNARHDWESNWDELFKDEFDEDTLDSAYEEMLRQVQDELTSN
jgi:nitrate reductase beta subunit